MQNNLIKYYDPSGYSGKTNEKGRTTPKKEEGQTTSEGNAGTSLNAIRKVQDDILNNIENCGGHLLKKRVGKRDSDLLKRASKHVRNNLTKSQLFLVKDSSQLNGYRIVIGYPIF